MKKINLGNLYTITLCPKGFNLFVDESLKKEAEYALWNNSSLILKNISKKKNHTVFEVYSVENNINLYFSLGRTNDIIDDEIIYPCFFEQNFELLSGE